MKVNLMSSVVFCCLIVFFLLTESTLNVEGKLKKKSSSLSHHLKCDPDVRRTTCEIVIARGFNCQVHEVTTNQGYIVELHRIITPIKKGNPILLQPSIFSTSADFVINSRIIAPDPRIIGNNIGFELAKHGYDVWLSNNRGNEYGMKHQYLTPDMPKFWNFTFDEIAEFDLPAYIHYIKNITGKDHIGYIGHSQGATTILALLSQNNEFNQLVSPVVSLTPLTQNLTGAKSQSIVEAFFYSLAVTNWWEDFSPVFTKHVKLRKITSLACDIQSFARWTCERLFSIFANVNQIDENRLGVYVSHIPSSTSLKNFHQYIQMYRTGQFKRYDYGNEESNERTYGKKKPPIYQLNNITHPELYFIYSREDQLVSIDSIKSLMQDIPGAKEFYSVFDPDCNHMDMLLGPRVSIEVNQKIVSIFDEYSFRTKRFN